MAFDATDSLLSCGNAARRCREGAARANDAVVVLARALHDIATNATTVSGRAVRSRWATTSKFVEAMTDQHWIRRGTSICWYKRSTTTSVAKCYWTSPLSSSRIKVVPGKSTAPNRGESFARSPTRRYLSHARRMRECGLVVDALACKHAEQARPINFPSVRRGSERLRITRSQVHRPSAMYRFVNDVNNALSESQLPQSAGFALDSRPQIPTSAISQEVRR
jgi:hypothetical protein